MLCLDCSRRRVVVGESRCTSCMIGRATHTDAEFRRNKKVVLLTTPRICSLCGEGPRERDTWTVDHIKPLAEGGTHAMDNLRRAHYSCNSAQNGSGKVRERRSETMLDRLKRVTND